MIGKNRIFKFLETQISYMANQSLIERTAEKNVDDESLDSDVEEIISNIRTNESNVQYKSVSDSSWNILCTFEEIARKTVDDILESKNLVVSDSKRNELEDFSLVCSASWDDGKEMFRVKPISDEDGHLSSLVVPLDSEISENITVVDIHNNEGAFVADDIESQIDCDIHRLWDKNMYVKKFNAELESVYTEVEDTRTRREIFSDSIKKLTNEFEENPLIKQDSYRGWIGKTIGLATGNAIMIYLTYQLLTSFGIVGIPILALVSFMGLIPLFLFLSMVFQIIVGFHSTRNAIAEKGQKEMKPFFQVN